MAGECRARRPAVWHSRHARARTPHRRRAFDRSLDRRGHGGQARGTRPEGAGELITCTRILLVDDHPVVRRGLRFVLDAEPDLEVVAEAGDGAEAVARPLQDEIDLAILDVSMPRMTGIQAAAELNRRKPELRLLMLSMHDNE
jgi:PleD family two-component response regulator